MKKIKQVGGSHYKHLEIDPFEYCHRNGIGFIAGTAIKHITRYKQKAGKIDLLKAISEIKRLIAIEYPEKPKHRSKAAKTPSQGIKS